MSGFLPIFFKRTEGGSRPCWVRKGRAEKGTEPGTRFPPLKTKTGGEKGGGSERRGLKSEENRHVTK